MNVSKFETELSRAMQELASLPVLTEQSVLEFFASYDGELGKVFRKVLTSWRRGARFEELLEKLSFGFKSKLAFEAIKKALAEGNEEIIGEVAEELRIMEEMEKEARALTSLQKLTIFASAAILGYIFRIISRSFSNLAILISYLAFYAAVSTILLSRIEKSFEQNVRNLGILALLAFAFFFLKF